MNIPAKAYFLIVIMIFSLVIIGIAATMQSFAAKLLPIIASSVVFILGAIQLYKDISPSKDRETETNVAECKTEVPQVKQYYFMIGWTFCFFLSIYLIGLLASIFIFMLIFMLIKHVKWKISLLVTFLSSGIMYCVFSVGLKIDLYPGLFFILMGY